MEFLRSLFMVKCRASQDVPRLGRMGEESGGLMLDPNINKKGRLLRGFGGLMVLGVALFLQFFFDPPSPVWRVALVWSLFAGGLFMVFESFRGWCILRACGMKTAF